MRLRFFPSLVYHGAMSPGSKANYDLAISFPIRSRFSFSNPMGPVAPPGFFIGGAKRDGAGAEPQKIFLGPSSLLWL